MNRTLAYVSCIAALLTACAARSSVDSSDVQAAVAQVQGEPTPFAEKPATSPQTSDLTPEQKESMAFKAKFVSLDAEPYMQTDFTPQYAYLKLSCRENRTMSAFLHEQSRPAQAVEGGTTIFYTGEILPRPGTFWQRNSVYFDEALTTFPPIFETITKQVPNANGGFETRTERLFLGHERAIRDVLLPNLKTAKAMRLANNDGLGPTFDLTNIKADIEKLEAHCVPKDL